MTVDNHGPCSAKMAPLDLERMLYSAWEMAGSGGQEHPMKQPLDAYPFSAIGEYLVTNDIGPVAFDDPILSGRVLALNSLSDIYACAGTPTLALVTLVVDPRTSQEDSVKILCGMLLACQSDRVQIVGGHTALGNVQMAGLTVIGRPRRKLSKRAATIGDFLYLSKPLGSGIVLAKTKAGLCTLAETQEAVEVMSASNRAASYQLDNPDVHAATDVTGYGLLGHLSEMLSEKQGAAIDARSVPLLLGARDTPNLTALSPTLRNNLEYVQSRRRIPSSTLTEYPSLLDPQTNGGLLIAAAPSAHVELTSSGFVRIGHIVEADVITLF